MRQPLTTQKRTQVDELLPYFPIRRTRASRLPTEMEFCLAEEAANNTPPIFAQVLQLNSAITGIETPIDKPGSPELLQCVADGCRSESGFESDFAYRSIGFQEEGEENLQLCRLEPFEPASGKDPPSSHG
jgi:hypothetical protein